MGVEERRAAVGRRLAACGEIGHVDVELGVLVDDDQLEAPARIREVRRTIAQIKTLQTERASAAAKA